MSAFTGLALTAGYSVADLVTPFMKGAVLGLLENYYDYAQMILSVREKKKLNLASQIE